MEIYTTLNDIRKQGPCTFGWAKLLKSLGKLHADDDPISLEHILNSNGIADAVWSLRAIKNYDKELCIFYRDIALIMDLIFEEKELVNAVYAAPDNIKHKIEKVFRTKLV